MKLQNETTDFVLNSASIDACSEKVRSFLTAANVPKQDILRHAITMEEILLNTLSAQGETKFRLITGKRFFRPMVSLEIEGESYNAYVAQKEEGSLLGNHILKTLNLSPDYTYTGHTNRYQFRFRKKQFNPFVTLVIALALAFAFGMLGLLLPGNLRQTVLDSVLTPLHDTFLNILGCIAGPMIFLSVAWGIYGIGDASTFKQIGKKISLGYIVTVAVLTVILGLLCIPVFRLNFSGETSGASAASSIFSMVLGIIPKNIFSPFVDGNTLQIIFLAVTIGIALLFLGQKTKSVAIAVEQINLIVQFLIEFISKLVPYFIFIVVLKTIWSDTVSVFFGVGKIFLVFFGSTLVMTAGYVIYTAIRNRVNPITVTVKGLPGLLIGITTASSAAAFGTNLTACRSKYGIDDSITSFGLPLGMVTFKPVTALNFLSASLFFAEVYQVPISVSWIVALLFSAAILALATPPIPGGALTAYTVLFTQLGIPAEALAIVLACDTIFDFVDTGFDQFLLPCALLNQAKKFGLVNQKILKKSS